MHTQLSSFTYTAIFPILPVMKSTVPESLTIIAGKGAYPRLLAESAREQGVKNIFAVAFRGETHRSIQKVADSTQWLFIGQLEALLSAIQKNGTKHAVMAGQITPTSLFTVRLDSKMMALLQKLKARNAQTIFGAVADELSAVGVELLPASSFMESHMPTAGILTQKQPTEMQQSDIELGLTVARATSHLDVGQTVVIKEGTILAVEAFEGTDETILRAGRLGGAGAAIVKLAKPGHDMRFDIPVVGVHTIKLLAKTRAGVLALEEERSILLERDNVIRMADAIGLCIVVLKQDDKEHS
jgi:DUF1009 family protein